MCCELCKVCKHTGLAPGLSAQTVHSDPLSTSKSPDINALEIFNELRILGKRIFQREQLQHIKYFVQSEGLKEFSKPLRLRSGSC